MNISNNASYSQGLGLPEIWQKVLTAGKRNQYSCRTKAKSLVGISTPFDTKAHRRQHFAGFFMRTICTSFVTSLAKLHLNYGGLIEGAKAHRFLCSGSTNLGQSTTNRLVPIGGGYKNHTKEAATMATTPTRKPSKIYTFAIGNPNALHASFKKARTVSLVAQSEHQARAILSGLRLTFIKCLPVGGCQHA
ncbi:ash family protein [Vibrio parahaemolyticus]|uniref:ash family protein n=1 Tax=Vibrio parahaemolyticus TaxID=670 RepID=UPI001B80E9BF|nr:ash family protein [Vibrio parahaemolyticus]EKH9212308.1 ash family protein [Vibrio parahaemolyticus]MCR9891349.1 ash family protein [Vibrio parahaemolyticus]MCR9919558.1 ash family protein [Vibrio parahaemolyticus]MDF4366419.1 ash family protein [Vibrio parahaemolyticus]HBC3486422.1 ash family protein [Vibrio parahaemolyticus]